MLNKLRHHDVVRLLSFLQPNILGYVGLLLINALIVAVLWNIILAFILKEVVDSAVQGEWASLQRAFGFACVCRSLSAYRLGCYVQYRINVYTRKTLTHLRQRVFHQVVNFPMSRAERQNSGDLLLPVDQ